VHGGEWRWAVRDDSGFPAKTIHRQGAAIIAIGFDAVPAIDLVGQVDTVRRAGLYLVENAARFGLDPTRRGTRQLTLAQQLPRSTGPMTKSR
jgi:acetyl esterase/lipase